MKNIKSILITGASSGLGKALAISYAKKGFKLFLTGRNLERLQQVQLEAEALGATVLIKSLDITHTSDVASWVKDICKHSNINIVIANAGISGGTSGIIEDEQQSRDIFNTNLNGVLNIIYPLIPVFKKQKYGQIAIISSLAAYRGLPSCPSYSASKAAVKIFGEALRGTLATSNIKVNVVTPGYIKTPMTKINKFPMPFIMDARKAANIILKGLEKNKARITFPFPLAFIVWLMSILSPIITDPIYSRLPRKDNGALDA